MTVKFEAIMLYSSHRSVSVEGTDIIQRLPAEFTVGSTGIMQAEVRRQDGGRRYPGAVQIPVNH